MAKVDIHSILKVSFLINQVSFPVYLPNCTVSHRLNYIIKYIFVYIEVKNDQP